MAVLNILVEMVRKDSIFRFRELFNLSLWHIIIWLIFGLIFGIIYSVLQAIRSKAKPLSLYRVISVCIFLSCWLLAFGYLNLFSYSGYVHAASLLLNIGIILIGIILFLILRKILKGIKTNKFLVFLRFYTGALIIIILFSFVSSQIYSRQKDMKITAAKGEENHKFNVVLIVLDAVRYDHLSCYNSNSKTTPIIDSLAEEGVLFENAFSVSSYTLESIPSLLTSCYPSVHNVRMATSAFPQNLLTLPEIFKSYGYRTSVFSVNSYVSIPQGYNRGVDDFFGLDTDIIKVNRTVLGLILRYLPTFPVLHKTFESILELSHFMIPSDTSFESVDPILINRKVTKWLEAVKGEPFFIYVHYDGGHEPYDPPESFWRLFDPDYQGKPVAKFPDEMRYFLPYVRGKPLPEEYIDNLIAHYDGEIFYHDKCLGDLLSYLEKTKLVDNTIVVITSDHGEEFYEHQAWGHGHSLYEELIHVPLIFWCPELFPKDKRIGKLVSLVDVYPTLLRLCGISETLELPYAIDGIDLSSLFQETDSNPALEFIFSEFNQGKNFIRCLRTEDFKAIDTRFGLKTEKMLFDLRKDPGEKNNIYEEHSQIARGLFNKLDMIVKRAKERNFKPGKALLDERQKEWLRTLGYIK